MNNGFDLFPPAAMWIGSPHPFDLHEVYLDFRSPAGFVLDDAPEQAELRITADSRYRLWVNGRSITRGPARSWPASQQVDVVDLTEVLSIGPNIIAVQVYQPGYSHFSYVHRAAAGVLAALFVKGQPVLWTGNHWRVRRDPAFAESAPRVSIYGSGVEVRDLAVEDGWRTAKYDDSTWASARIVAATGGSPWTHLRMRMLPQMRERLLPLAPLEMRVGPFAPPAEGDPHEFVRKFWSQAPRVEYAPDDSGWITAPLKAGETAAWLCDLGRDYTCQGVVEFKAAAGHETLLMSYAEKLAQGELVISDPSTYCRVRLTDRFALRTGDQLVESFTLRGGRFLLFVLTGPTGPETQFRLAATVAEYPLPATPPLRTGDAELDAIAEMCETTVRACMQETFVDCVWRESSQWLGDALPEALVMAHITDDVRPLLAAISMAAEGAYPDGVLPGVAPGEVHAYTIVDYNFMWVELLALALELTHDPQFVKAQWPVLSRMLNRFARDVSSEGLIYSQPGRRLFLDWAPVSRNEPSAIYNLHYLLALQVAADIAHRVGMSTDALRWEERATSVRNAARSAFWDGSHWWDDLGRTTFSQLAAALAVLTHSVTKDEAAMLLDAIVERSLDLADGPLPDSPVLASPFMHHYIFESLQLTGRHHDVVAIIRARWGRWAKAGFPTTWENWNVDFPDGSQCHAFSAHPRHHLVSALAAMSRDRSAN